MISNWLISLCKKDYVNFISCIIIACLGISVSGFAQNEHTPPLNLLNVYPVNRGHSYVGFSIEYMGYAKIRGRFENFTGTVVYDENDINSTSITLIVRTKSIDTDHNFRDNDLRSENWFGVEQYPIMLFESKNIVNDGNSLQVIGDLSIKNVKKEVTISLDPPSGVLTDTRGDSQVIFTGRCTIDRTVFGVEGERWSKIKEGITAVDSEVDIEFSILSKRTNLTNMLNRYANPEYPTGKIYKTALDSGVKDALTQFEEMIKEDNNHNNESILNIVGDIFFLDGKIDTAKDFYEHNAYLYPSSSLVYESLARLAYTKGHKSKAISLLQKSLEKDPQNTVALELIKRMN